MLTWKYADRDTKKLPAQVLFGRPIRDLLLSLKRKFMGEPWETLADQRALALARRGTKMIEYLFYRKEVATKFVMRRT